MHSRRIGDSRNWSPPSKRRDHRQSDYHLDRHPDHYPSYTRNVRSPHKFYRNDEPRNALSPPRALRRLSPDEPVRSRRAFVDGNALTPQALRRLSPDEPVRSRRAFADGNALSPQALRRLSPDEPVRSRRAFADGNALSPPRALRRLSPDEPMRSRRAFADGEKREYSKHFDEDNDDRFEQHWERSHFHEKFPPGGSSSMEYKQKYRMPDPTSLIDDSSHSLKHVGGSENTISRIRDEKEYQGIGSSSLDGHGMLVQKPMYLDDGTVRTFFTLPPNSGSNVNSSRGSGNFLSSSSRNPSIGLHRDEEIRYREQIHSNKRSTRKSYEEPMLSGRREDEELGYREQMGLKIALKNIPSRESYEEVEPMFYTRDVSYPIVSASQSKALWSTSSGLTMEDNVGCRLPLEGFGKGSGNFIDPYSRNGNSSAPQFDSAKDLKDPIYYQQNAHSPLRDEHKDYNYPGLGRRKNLDSAYTADELYRKMPLTSQEDYADRELSRPSYMDPEFTRSYRSVRRSSLLDHHSVQGDPISSFLDMERTPLVTEQDKVLLSSRSNHLEFRTRISSDLKITSVGSDYGFEREEASRSYRDRLTNAVIPQFESDPYGLDLSPQRRLKAEELGNYDSSERILKRKYIMEEELSRHNSSSTLSSGRTISREIEEPGGSNTQRSNTILGGLSFSKRLNFGRHQYRKDGMKYEEMETHRASARDDHFSFADRLVHAQQQSGGNISIKRRLRPGPLSSDRLAHAQQQSGGNISIKTRLRPGPLSSHNRLDIRKDSYKLKKFKKRILDNQRDSLNVRNCDALENHATPAKSDVPEDSEEFKHQVHRAFLRFSKQLNENPAQRRRHLEEGKAGTLLCSVCGSLSTEFVDTRSLVKHAFTSLKVGLRADHLGLHQALCTLMGWKSAVLHGDAWVQQVLPDAEASSLKEDLILWPPLVIIHNTSILNENPDKRKVVTVEEMDAILREMGFGAEKTKVCRGKPANQSIMVVKFKPTFSGLQEAERLHNYYAENKHGREELLQINSKSGVKSGEAVEQASNHVDHVLYGYMGIATDMDKLDFGTKSKCIVKSKKDIQAIADAPLKTD